MRYSPQRLIILAYGAAFVNRFFRNLPIFLLFIVEHTVTVTVEFGVGDLIPEFLAHALILGRPLQPAGTIATCPLQALPDSLYHFRILIQPH